MTTTYALAGFIIILYGWLVLLSSFYFEHKNNMKMAITASSMSIGIFSSVAILGIALFLLDFMGWT